MALLSYLLIYLMLYTHSVNANKNWNEIMSGA